jgi:sarcosine oxidase
MEQYDVVVCGLGVMGSAALYQLAQRGTRVLGIDRFPSGHDRGSSHGETRIIRLAYWEHPSYVPLLHRAYDLWRELETTAGRPLLHITGIAEIGPPDGTLVTGTLASARLHGIAHEALAARDVMRRYPAFRLPAHYVGVLQLDGGFVEAEPAVQALQALARKHGAEIRIGETVRAVEAASGAVHIVTSDVTVKARAAIIAAGAWTASLLPGLALPLRATRQVMGWFAPVQSDVFAPGKFPVFLIESEHGIHYGFPPFGAGGIKVAKHHHRDEVVNPDSYDRCVADSDVNLIRDALADYLPAANGALMDAKTCLYTMTLDGDFIIDRHPGTPSIVIASPCSGHGFKFAPVIGEILADLATGKPTGHDISRFRIDRFR